ncbi:DUF222 domain-containing protein, partial [Spirillospora sp. NPDC048819]|uniref:HNH endonuclease signature motif containing protein n=1 Tax=Spirillospora sp. NPDC048819 TaxID=3155268 RepID=UPI0033CFD860
ARRQTSWAQARELAAIAELTQRRTTQATTQATTEADTEADGDPGYRTLTAHEAVTEEVAAALTVTGNTAATLIHLAEQLTGPLAHTGAALETGRIDLPKARVICDTTQSLPEHLTQRVEALALHKAPTQTTGQLRRRIKRITQRLAPEAMQERKREALRQRRLELWDTAAGTTDLALCDLAPEHAHGIFNKITAAAHGLRTDGDTRPLHLIRADLAVHLLNGTPLPAATHALRTQTTQPDTSTPAHNNTAHDSTADASTADASTANASTASGPVDGDEVVHRPVAVLDQRATHPRGRASATGPPAAAGNPLDQAADRTAGGGHNATQDGSATRTTGNNTAARHHTSNGRQTSNGHHTSDEAPPARTPNGVTHRPVAVLDQQAADPRGRASATGPPAAAGNPLDQTTDGAAGGPVDGDGVAHRPVAVLDQRATDPRGRASATGPPAAAGNPLDQTTDRTAGGPVDGDGVAHRPVAVLDQRATRPRGRASATERPAAVRNPLGQAPSRTAGGGHKATEDGSAGTTRNDTAAGHSRSDDALAASSTPLTGTADDDAPGADTADTADTVIAGLAAMVNRRLTHLRDRTPAAALPAATNQAIQQITDRLAPQRDATCQADAARHGRPGYRPPATLRQEIEERHTTCVFPTCNQPSHRCDLDHTVPWRPGITCRCNLAPLCRRHHRLKQTPGWKLHHIWPGLLIWTTPAGAWYIIRPDRQ